MTDSDFSSQRCAYAMATLLRRIIDEDYVRPERISELQDRAIHLGRGDGFLTGAELKQRGAPLTNPKIEDLLS